MHSPTEILLLLLVAVCVIAMVAQRLKLSTPIACVIGGMALAMVPGFPEFQIPPDMILLIFLPILLTEAAYLTSVRDFRRNIRPISQLAFGLVIFTAIVVAVTMNWLFPGIGWAAGLVLGAIVSPPDAVAATSIIKNLKIPKRIVTILEGESLINDATGLVIYKFAVVAVVTGAFSVTQAGSHFMWMVASGISIGWLFGFLYIKFFPKIKEQSVEILSTFLVPYAAYIATEFVHGSGVLAVVTSGIITGWLAPRYFSSAFRIQSQAVWRMVIFVMNSLVFMLIGLYFPTLVKRLSYISTDTLIESAIIMSLVIIVTRFVWVYVVTYGQIWLTRKIYRKRKLYPAWQNVFIVAWTGMRGVVSLATALALPLTVQNGDAFPYRDLIIFISFSVILATLVLQGLTLPWLVNKLALIYDPQHVRENWLARKEAAQSAMDKLHEIAARKGLYPAALERITGHYNDRILSLGDGPNTPLNRNEAPKAENHPIIQAENDIWQEVLQTERNAIIKLRQSFHISDEVMNDLLREVDLMSARFMDRD